MIFAKLRRSTIIISYKGTQVIDTTRLILRKFELTDSIHMFKNWSNDFDVCKYLSWEPHGDISVTQQIIQDWVNSYSDDACYNWAIIYKLSGEAIGSISLIQLDEQNESCEVGYCMSNDFWGLGIMTEALNYVIQYMFDKIGVNRIVAKHDVQNPASGKVMKKCGMKFEGILRQSIKDRGGNFCDYASYSILRNDI